MPNHVENTITVSNATPEQVKRIVDACEQEKLAEEFHPQPDWPSTPREDGMLPGPVYFRRHTGRHGLWKGGPLCDLMGRKFPDGTQDSRWYSWNVTEWGTKWGAYDLDVSVDNDGIVTIFFNTAWSPLSDGWFQKMSEQLPGAEIECHYSEPGCDFYGVVIAKDGNANSESSDISDVKYKWLQATYSAEDIERFQSGEDEDEEFVDEVNEAWWDVDYEFISQAQDEMAERIEKNFNDRFKDALTGLELVKALNSIDDSTPIQKWTELQVLQAMEVAGYLPKGKYTTADDREEEFRTALNKFMIEVIGTDEYISRTVKHMPPPLVVK